MHPSRQTDKQNVYALVSLMVKVYKLGKTILGQMQFKDSS